MSMRNIALSVALLVAFCGFAIAQEIPQPPPYPNQGYYGQPASPAYQSPNWGNPAYQRGYQDGFKDGHKDWQDNHAFRPTGTEKYEDAPGYDKSYGDKTTYRQMYQEGYLYGYQVGYNGNAQAAYPPYGPVYAPQGPAYPPAAYANNPGYRTGFQDGLNDGQQDRQGGQAYRAMATSKYEHTPGYDSSYGDKDQYKQAYRQGYVAGYQQGFGMTAGYAAPVYPAYGYAYPPQPAYATSQAYQIGYQDGVNDGRKDRVSGKAYRATRTDKYDDAPGYNKTLGDKNQYKEFYRQGYVAGYQAGFNGKVH